VFSFVAAHLRQHEHASITAEHEYLLPDLLDSRCLAFSKRSLLPLDTCVGLQSAVRCFRSVTGVRRPTCELRGRESSKTRSVRARGVKRGAREKLSGETRMAGYGAQLVVGARDPDRERRACCKRLLN